MLLRGVRYCPSICSYALRGTERAYAGRFSRSYPRRVRLRWKQLNSRSENPKSNTRNRNSSTLCTRNTAGEDSEWSEGHVPYPPTVCCSALCGTALAYAAVLSFRMLLRVCCGTALPYAATPSLRHCASISAYAVCGTELAYAATGDIAMLTQLQSILVGPRP
eukprot:3401038-Rhodomonas_salina.1